MDFIVALPKVKANDMNFVVINRTSKYIHLFALSHPYIVAKLAQLFAREILKLHGFPLYIGLNWDQVSLGQFCKEVLSRTKLKYSTTCHP